MHCDYYAAGRCRSCTLIEQPYDAQLAGKVAHARSLVRAPVWLDPVASVESGFRNKAKMVVSGTLQDPRLGLLEEDLRGCGLHEPAIVAALPHLADFVTLAALTPYDVAGRRGELKHLLVTANPAGELVVRFVLRTTEALPRIRKHLDRLRERLPDLAVVSVNLQPEHKAVLEGAEEVVLHGTALRMPVGDVELHLLPQSFFQTNTAVASALYRQAAAWTDALPEPPGEVWDLYCGVGGFALHLAAPGRRVVGVEVAAEAVASATSSALSQHREAHFVADDAIRWAIGRSERPDLVVVNPPRRGIGPDLAGWLEHTGVRDVLYSSCHAESLARDLAAMPSLRPQEAVVLDMFPQTGHYEVLVRLSR